MARKITTADIPQNVRKKSRKVFCGMFYEFVHVHGFGLAWTRLNYYVYVEAEALDGWQFVILHMQQQQKTYFRTYICVETNTHTHKHAVHTYITSINLYAAALLSFSMVYYYFCVVFLLSCSVCKNIKFVEFTNVTTVTQFRIKHTQSHVIGLSTPHIHFSTTHILKWVHEPLLNFCVFSCYVRRAVEKAKKNPAKTRLFAYSAWVPYMH